MAGAGVGRVDPKELAENCIAKDQKVQADFAKGYKDGIDALKNKNEKEGVQAFLEALHSMADMAKDRCTTFGDKGLNWHNVMGFAKELKNKATTMQVQGDKVMFNGKDMTKQFMEAAQAEEQHIPGKAGYILGETFTELDPTTAGAAK